MEHLPLGKNSPAMLLVKHQSTLETLLMPTLMPHPLAYVFKNELLYIPFFGWAHGAPGHDPHRPLQGAQAFATRWSSRAELLAQRHLDHHVPRGHAHPARAKGHVQDRRHAPGGGNRCAGDSDCRHLGQVWPRKAFIKRPGVVDVSIGKPIPSAGRDPEELMREVEAWIEAEMRRLDPEAYLR